MDETYEKELIDIAFNCDDRLGERQTKIVPPEGIKSITLYYIYKLNAYSIRFSRLENVGGMPFTLDYDLIDDFDGNLEVRKVHKYSDNWGFRDKTENEMLKIALALTTEELNNLADKALK